MPVQVAILKVRMSSEPLTPENTPKEGQSGERQSTQASGVEVPVGGADATQTTVAATGGRQAFLNLRRQLTESELANSGVQKLLLDQLDRADSECESLTGYVERFHEADKRAAVLEEKLRTQTAFEIIVAAAIAIGSAIIGLAPSLWDKSSTGPITLIIGFLLVLGAVIARLFRK